MFSHFVPISNHTYSPQQATIHPERPSQPVMRRVFGVGGRDTAADHQPSHQDEPGGAVVEGVLAVAEDVRALLGAGVRAGVVHEGFVVDQVGHLALPLVSHLRDLRVSGGEGGRGRAVGQALVDAAVEDGRAGGGGGFDRMFGDQAEKQQVAAACSHSFDARCLRINIERQRKNDNTKRNEKIIRVHLTFEDYTNKGRIKTLSAHMPNDTESLKKNIFQGAQDSELVRTESFHMEQE